MPGQIDKRYLTFYLEGREDVIDGGVEAEFDIDALVRAIRKTDNISAGLHSVTRTAAEKTFAHLETTSERAEWIDEHHQALEAGGHDVDDAYLAFCVGRIDEVRYMLEQDVVGRLIDLDGEGESEPTTPTT
jgi:hypothetical protein